jgi:hypothetical protein
MPVLTKVVLFAILFENLPVIVHEIVPNSRTRSKKNGK